MDNKWVMQVLDNRMRRVKAGEVDLNAEKRPLIDHFIAQYEKGDWSIEEVHLELNSAIFGGVYCTFMRFVGDNLLDTKSSPQILSKPRQIQLDLLAESRDAISSNC